MYASGATVAWWNPYKAWQWYAHYHNGLDVAGPSGLALRALETGVVKYMGWGFIPNTSMPNGGGWIIIVEIRPGTRYIFNHCSGFPPTVRQGQIVQKGQVIAYIGQSGVATGDHCHVSLEIDETVGGVTRNLAWNPKFFMSGGPYANDYRISPVHAQELPDTGVITEAAQDMKYFAQLHIPGDTGRPFDVKAGVTLRKLPGTQFPVHFRTTVPVKYRLVGFDTVNGKETGWVGASSITNPASGIFFVPPEH